MSDNIKYGIIFDTQRFALNDGPGIRTTVFFKGCPLSCQWCHNPEAMCAKPEIAFYVDKCVQCRECASVCTEDAHIFTGGKHVFNRDMCLSGFNCVDACNFDALQVTGKETSVGDIMKTVVKDRVYYEQSGGGLTISGGEPLNQITFLIELLVAAKKERIHTCVDTSGFASKKTFEKILPLTDYFLFDYKVTDEKEHIRLTGVSNKPILNNLDYLYNEGAKIRLRCPLIPDVNDTDEHLKAIAELNKKYPDLDGIEIMPYHNTANAKFERYGYINTLPKIPTADANVKEIWDKKLKSYGLSYEATGGVK